MTSNTGNVCDTAVTMQANAQKRGRKRKSAKMLQKWQFAPISFPEMQTEDFSEIPISIKANLKPTATSLTGFAGESSLPIGRLSLNIELVDENNANLVRQGQLDFYVMRTSSRYNMLLGRSALVKFGIVSSTIHGMVKFTTRKGVATVSSASVIPVCATVTMKGAVKECADAEINMVVVNLEYPDQKIKIGLNISADTKAQIVQLLMEYMDVFAWGMAPDRTKWLCEEVTKLIAAGILREVKYQSWNVNSVLVKKPDGSWRMCIDFKDLNKAC
ncbi:uncharacterized protein [Rutidosis leptorrhynchoides]|uniref:uncharacterized protein n=1 Tax=Rutidosis leptorrhynchoides TaxID=125765 RepID=UPI003A99F972